MQRTDPWRAAAVTAVALTGLIAIGNGVYLIVGDHPFNGPDDYSDEIGMSKADARVAAPAVAGWTMHVSDQVGAMRAGWGLFVVGLAVTGLRAGVTWARNVLWIGGLPTLLATAVGKFIRFGRVDTSTVLSVIALALFVLGMGLSYVPAATSAKGSAQSA